MSTSGWEGPDPGTKPPLNPDLEAMLKELEHHACWLLYETKIYMELFCDDPQRVELLNTASPHLFGLFQGILRDSVVLKICRMTDNPRIGGNNTLVLDRLCQLIQASDRALGDKLDIEIKRIKMLSTPIREWRNNKLAHLNLEVHLDSANNPMAGFPWFVVENAAAGIRDCLDIARKELTDGEFRFDAVDRWQGVDSLLLALIQSQGLLQLETEDPVKIDTLLRAGKWGTLYALIEDGPSKQ